MLKSLEVEQEGRNASNRYILASNKTGCEEYDDEEHTLKQQLLQKREDTNVDCFSAASLMDFKIALFKCFNLSRFIAEGLDRTNI